MFPRLPARATFAADTNLVSGTQKMFLILFRKSLCPQQMFPSLRAQGNIMSNNVSATMCPRLPVQNGCKTQDGRMTKKCGARLCIPVLARHFFRHSAVLSLTAVLLRKVPIVIQCGNLVPRVSPGSRKIERVQERALRAVYCNTRSSLMSSRE